MKVALCFDPQDSRCYGRCAMCCVHIMSLLIVKGKTGNVMTELIVRNVDYNKSSIDPQIFQPIESFHSPPILTQKRIDTWKKHCL